MLAFLSLALALLASPSLIAAQGTPSFLLYNPTRAVVTRQYATCAQDVTAVGQNSSSVGMFVIGGFNAAAVFQDSLDYSNTGYFTATQAQLQVTPNFTFSYPGQFTGSGPIARLGAFAAVLGNGNLIVGSGKYVGSYNRSNDVIYSTDLGKTFNVATAAAPFAQRSDAAVAAAPGTNIVVIAAGATGLASNSGGTPTNDIWMRSQHHTSHSTTHCHPDRLRRQPPHPVFSSLCAARTALERCGLSRATLPAAPTTPSPTVRWCFCSTAATRCCCTT